LTAAKIKLQTGHHTINAKQRIEHLKVKETQRVEERNSSNYLAWVCLLFGYNICVFSDLLFTSFIRQSMSL